jgi:hypothetical protein
MQRIVLFLVLNINSRTRARVSNISNKNFVYCGIYIFTALLYMNYKIIRKELVVQWNEKKVQGITRQYRLEYNKYYYKL